MITEIIIILINSLNIRFVYSYQIYHLFSIMLSYSQHGFTLYLLQYKLPIRMFKMIYDLRKDKLLVGMI